MLKTVLANAEEGKLTSKGVISQILTEEHCCIHVAGGDATAYYAKNSGKVKKKKDNGKKCSHCKCKGHNISECHTLKWEQEKSSGSTFRSGTSSSVTAARWKSTKLNSHMFCHELCHVLYQVTCIVCIMCCTKSHVSFVLRAVPSHVGHVSCVM